MFQYGMDHVCSVAIQLSPPQRIGAVPEGLRLIFLAKGGEVTGPKVQGKILPGYGDWLLVRTDGVGIIDVRGVVETNDNALLYVTISGVLDFGEDAYRNMLAGEAASGRAIRTAARFQTSSPAYAWLNRLQCVGIGESLRERGEIAADVYAIT
jgi:hypothetical protein